MNDKELPDHIAKSRSLVCELYTASEDHRLNCEARYWLSLKERVSKPKFLKHWQALVRSRSAHNVALLVERIKQIKTNHQQPVLI